jgi:hypothetical protein
MKPANWMSLMAAGAFALLGSACGPVQSTGEAVEPSPEMETAAFEPGGGLRIAEETRAAMKLTFAAVSSREFVDLETVAARCLGRAGEGAEHQLRASIQPDRQPFGGAAIRVRDVGHAGGPLAANLTGIDRQLLAVDGSLELIAVVAGNCEAMAGESLELVYQVGPARTSAAVPVAAVVRAALGDFVFEEVEDRLQRRRVTVGAENDGWLEIRSGLKTGARVVETGARELWILELSLVGGMSNLETVKEAD